MSLATCLTIATMALAAHEAEVNRKDPHLMRLLAEAVTATPELEAWLWDVAAAAFCLQIHFNKKIAKEYNPEVRLSSEKEKQRERCYWNMRSLGFLRELVRYVRENLGKVPPSLSSRDGEVDVESLVWIFEDV
jgi:hypothetical protein